MKVLKRVLGGRVKMEVNDIERHCIDWTGQFQGRSDGVLYPTKVEEVQEILEIAHKERIPIVCQGGNTGLVGGAIPMSGEVVLSMEKMDRIFAFDETNGIVSSESGVILANLDAHVRDYGYMIPLDLGSKGSCQIGGNVATNAGGIRYIRYGSMFNNVVGMEVVLPGGQILDYQQCLMRKDNTGYPMKQLFIGSEGSLGVITKVSMLCTPYPSSIQACLVVCKRYEEVLKVLRAAKGELHEILSAFEMMDYYTIDRIVDSGVVGQYPIGYNKDNVGQYHVLIETMGSNKEGDRQRMESFLAGCMEEGWVEDGCIGESHQQMKEIWHIRENAAEAAKRSGYVEKFDISIHQKYVDELLVDLRARLLPSGYKIMGYGHIGDGNIHLNIIQPNGNSEHFHGLLYPYIYDWVIEKKGSISAEHGLGQLKVGYLDQIKDPQQLAYLRQVKRMFDPHGILNPNKVIV